MLQRMACAGTNTRNRIDSSADRRAHERTEKNTPQPSEIIIPNPAVLCRDTLLEIARPQCQAARWRGLHALHRYGRFINF